MAGARLPLTQTHSSQPLPAQAALPAPDLPKQHPRCLPCPQPWSKQSPAEEAWRHHRLPLVLQSLPSHAWSLLADDACPVLGTCATIAG